MVTGALVRRILAELVGTRSSRQLGFAPLSSSKNRGKSADCEPDPSKARGGGYNHGPDEHGCYNRDRGKHGGIKADRADDAGE